MGTKRTPGPWRAEGWENTVVNSAEGDTIVLCPGGSMNTPLAEMKANSALIAAAPDLLAELRNNREMLIELRDQHLNHTAAVVRALVQKRIEAADAAIAKAEGGA